MLLLPIMAVVKLAYLKQGDHAPVLFKQKRIGKDGKEIEILKVRSMVYNAEEVLEKLMKEDPKIREEYTKKGISISSIICFLYNSIDLSNAPAYSFNCVLITLSVSDCFSKFAISSLRLSNDL